MTPGEVMAALDALIVEMQPGDDACSLLGNLVEREERLRLKLRAAAVPTANGNGNGHAEPERLLTPEQAAGIAAVPKTRIYAWARGQRWASRPSKRCLRIAEASFRRWLAAKVR